MAQSQSHYKSQPAELKSSTNYDDWTKLIGIWRKVTSLTNDKQGPAVALVLQGEAQKAVLELKTEELTAEDGLDKIITRLDKIYAKDKLSQTFSNLELFESYKRASNISMRDFLNQ